MTQQRYPIDALDALTQLREVEAERDKLRAQLETSKRAGDILESSLAIVRKERDALTNTVASLNEYRGDLEAERDELRRLLAAALEQNPTWSSNEAFEAEQLLEDNDG